MNINYKHSGALGDLIYSMAICKHFGPGNFYLHLDQLDWIGRHYYGSAPNPFHQGRMTKADYVYMRDFMLAQDYIKSFDILDPKTAEITHNLDRFRTLFVNHPDNYVHIYAEVFGLSSIKTELSSQPWLTVPNTDSIEGRPICINRSERWLPTHAYPDWHRLKPQLESQSFFVGLSKEYDLFRTSIGWDIPYVPTGTQLDLAKLIKGSRLFIGNQSQCLALAVGLGQNYVCEPRQDLPIERNECYFATNPRGQYMGLTTVNIDHII